jgi:hypothetical protein
MRVCGVSRASALAAAIALAGMSFSAADATETKSYAMSWFSEAAASEDGDCPGGINPPLIDQYARDLRDLGIPGSDIERLIKMKIDGNVPGGWEKDELEQLINSRARVNGKPANAYANPYAVVDPKLKVVTGKHAYGFNLDGKGKDDPNAFEDPQTHEKGIDHQLFRALGCIEPFRGTLQHDPAFWIFMWTTEKDTAPAWLISVSGEDLSKDGPVTVTFGRALEPTKFNGNGEARADMTFRWDPDKRLQQNVFKGEIKDGVITVAAANNLHLLQDPLTFPSFDLHQLHVRFKVNPDGSLSGFIGGYQPIEQIYFALGQGNLAAEDNFSPELPGMYHAMRKLADADPDPKTGQNWSISAAYKLNAIPAFVVPAEESPRARSR